MISGIWIMRNQSETFGSHTVCVRFTISSLGTIGGNR